MPSPVEKQVASLLKEIESVAGVRHVIVCDNQGKVLGALGAVRDPKESTRIGSQVALMLSTIERISGKPRETQVQFQDGALLVHDLGNAFVVIGTTPNVNESLLRMTLNVAATAFTQDQNVQKTLAQVIPIRKVINVLSIFANALIGEFGERGVGAARFAQALAPGLEKLKARHAFFQPVTMTDGWIDLTPLERASETPAQIISGWADLIALICNCAVQALGEQVANAKYNAVGRAVLERHAQVFVAMDLESVIPSLDLPWGMG